MTGRHAVVSFVAAGSVGKLFAGTALSAFYGNPIVC